MDEVQKNELLYHAKTCTENKDYAGAIADYEQLLILNPNWSSDVIQGIKGMIAKLQETLHSEEIRKQEMAKIVRFQELYEHGKVCAQNEDYAGAIADFEQLRILAPDRKDAYNGIIAKLQEALRAKEKAKQAEKEAQLFEEAASKAEEKWRELAGDDWYEWENTDDSNDLETSDAPYHGDDYNSNTPKEETTSMEILDNMNYPLGSVDENGVILNLMNCPKGHIGADGTIYDDMNYPIGRINKDGTIMDNMNYPKGRIGADGTVYDNLNYPKGRVRQH